MSVIRNLTFDRIHSSVAKGPIRDHLSNPNPIQESQRLGNDTLQYIEASERTVFDPEVHEKYHDMALESRKVFDRLSQRDPQTETKISKAIKRLETIKRSHAGILRGIRYIEDTGRVSRGVMSDRAAPDVFNLFSQIRTLKNDIHADRRVYSEDLADDEIAPSRVHSHLEYLETQARSAVEIAISKDYIKGNQEHIKELLKSADPEAVWEFLSSKIEEVIKLRKIPNGRNLADKLSAYYLVPVRDTLESHTNKLKNKVGKNQLVGEFQEMSESLHRFFLDGEWDTSDVRFDNSTSTDSVPLASSVVETDPEHALPLRSTPPALVAVESVPSGASFRPVASMGGLTNQAPAREERITEPRQSENELIGKDAEIRKHERELSEQGIVIQQQNAKIVEYERLLAEQDNVIQRQEDTLKKHATMSFDIASVALYEDITKILSEHQARGLGQERPSQSAVAPGSLCSADRPQEVPNRSALLPAAESESSIPLQAKTTEDRTIPHRRKAPVLEPHQTGTVDDDNYDVSDEERRRRSQRAQLRPVHQSAAPEAGEAVHRQRELERQLNDLKEAVKKQGTELTKQENLIRKQEGKLVEHESLLTEQNNATHQQEDTLRKQEIELAEQKNMIRKQDGRLVWHKRRLAEQNNLIQQQRMALTTEKKKRWQLKDLERKSGTELSYSSGEEKEARDTDSLFIENFEAGKGKMTLRADTLASGEAELPIVSTEPISGQSPQIAPEITNATKVIPPDQNLLSGNLASERQRRREQRREKTKRYLLLSEPEKVEDAIREKTKRYLLLKARAEAAGKALKQSQKSCGG